MVWDYRWDIKDMYFFLCLLASLGFRFTVEGSWGLEFWIPVYMFPRALRIQG